MYILYKTSIQTFSKILNNSQTPFQILSECQANSPCLRIQHTLSTYLTLSIITKTHLHPLKRNLSPYFRLYPKNPPHIKKDLIEFKDKHCQYCAQIQILSYTWIIFIHRFRNWANNNESWNGKSAKPRSKHIQQNK